MKYQYTVMNFGTIREKPRVVSYTYFGQLEDFVVQETLRNPHIYAVIAQTKFEHHPGDVTEEVKINLYQNGYCLVRDITDLTVDAQLMHNPAETELFNAEELTEEPEPEPTPVSIPVPEPDITTARDISRFLESLDPR